MNIGKLFKSIYKLFIKGKTVKIGSGSITFPEQGNNSNSTPLEFPHKSFTDSTEFPKK